LHVWSLAPLTQAGEDPSRPGSVGGCSRGVASWGTQVSRSLARRGGSRRRARASVPPAIPGGSGTVPVRRGSCGGLRPPSCGWAGRVPTGGAVPSVVGRHPAHRGGRSLPASRSSWGRAGPVGVAGRAPLSGCRWVVGGALRSSARRQGRGRSGSTSAATIPRLAWCHGWRAGGLEGAVGLSRPLGPSGRVPERGSVGVPRTGSSVGVIRTPRADRALPVWSPVSGSGRPGGVHYLRGSSLGSHGATDPVSFFLVRGPLRS